MEREGVIKFDLLHDQQPLDGHDISAIRAWRLILFDLGLIGRDPNRYGGLGFGNISLRTPRGFVISGSQTGHLSNPGIESYAEVIGWSLEANCITSIGRVKPSSESLTHAAVYELSPRIGCVFHVHSPGIWHCCQNASDQMDSSRDELYVDVPESQYVDVPESQYVDVPESHYLDVPKTVPKTASQVTYGTPAMAQEVARVCAGRELPDAFIMGGHEDGVVTYGASASDAGLLLVKLLAESLRKS